MCTWPPLRIFFYCAVIICIVVPYAFALAALWHLGPYYFLAGLIPCSALFCCSVLTIIRLRRQATRISQLQASQAHLHESQKRLIQTERLVAVGTLAAGVAHEFNNLLAAISGTAELAVDRDPNQQSTALSTIATMAQNGGRITYSLLAFARQTPHQQTITDVREAIEPAIALIQMEAKRFQIEIKYQFRPVPPLILDIDLISQVVMHLMTNAIDAMQPAGGGRLTIGCEQRGKEVCLSVSDTGTGIPEHIRDQIFEPFVTTKRSTSTSAHSHGGSGIGLAFSFGVIRDHGGRIEVDSRVGVGTTMMIYFPIPDSFPAPASPSRATISSHTQVEDFSAVPHCTLNVIVVDDDPIIAASLTEMVRRKDHMVKHFHHPEHLLADVTEQVDVIFSDKAMPSIDGLKLLEYIHSKIPYATLALVTGHIDDPDIGRAITMGIHVVQKPFSRLTIDRILQIAMAAKQSRQAATIADRDDDSIRLSHFQGSGS